MRPASADGGRRAVEEGGLVGWPFWGGGGGLDCSGLLGRSIDAFIRTSADDERALESWKSEWAALAFLILGDAVPVRVHASIG